MNKTDLVFHFIQLFDSNVLKEKYLVNTSYFQKLIKDHPESKNELIQNIINHIHSEFSKSNRKNDSKNYQFYTLSYSADTAKEAQSLLNGYLNYISAILNEKLNTEIKDNINIKKSELSFMIDAQKVSIKDNTNSPIKILYLKKLQSLKLPDINVMPFEYMQEPTEPLQKTSPRSGMIILLSGILGLMFSIFYVLVQHYFSQRNRP